MISAPADIPVIVGGEMIRTGDTGAVVMPHDHGHVLATYHKAGPEQLERAVESSRQAWREWSHWPWQPLPLAS